uniref:Uncharacterized protein n=1 Tax=Cannabis sativa TaxID=3483 RepID=A0A803QE54_CANSA
MRWEPKTCTVTATDEVWDAYLKKYPNAKRYRKKGLPHYDMLGEIFNNTTATGGMSYASTQPPPTSVEECQQERHFIGIGAHIDVDVWPKEKKNKGANSAMEHVMEQLAKSIAAKTEASLVRSESMRKYID